MILYSLGSQNLNIQVNTEKNIADTNKTGLVVKKLFALIYSANMYSLKIQINRKKTP